MWIRTQNKMCVCNIKNMRGISIGKSGDDKVFFLTMRFSSERADNCELGEYKTEKRAIEVLEDICRFYVGLNVQDGMGCYFGGYVKNGIFQMPEV